MNDSKALIHTSDRHDAERRKSCQWLAMLQSHQVT